MFQTIEPSTTATFLSQTCRWLPARLPLTRTSAPSKSQIFQRDSTWNESAENFLVNGGSYTVPAGERLFVNQIRCQVTLDVARSVQVRVIVTGRHGTSQVLSFHEKMLQPGESDYSVALPVPLCVEGGTSVVFWLARSSAKGRWSGTLTATGHVSPHTDPRLPIR